jgi:hypothetical protein
MMHTPRGAYTHKCLDASKPLYEPQNLGRTQIASERTDSRPRLAADTACCSIGSGANPRVAGDDEEMQRFVPIEDLFKGRHFDRQIIVLCVSWYTSFKLSLRDLVIMMAERGISVTTTILKL